MKFHLRHLITIALIFVISCSHQKALQGNLKDDRRNLDSHNSFGFIHGGQEYYFSLKVDEIKKESCNYYVGYKNNDKAYSFSTVRFNELNTIYQKKSSPEERILIALKSIEEFSQEPTNKICSKATDWKDGIGWMTVALVLWPVTLMAVGMEVADNMADHLDEVQLNMSLKEMNKIFTNMVYKRVEGGRDYYVVDRKQRRLVMYFSNDRLTAFVRGWKPREN